MKIFQSFCASLYHTSPEMLQQIASHYKPINEKSAALTRINTIDLKNQQKSVKEL
jgi:hypothetical protein